MVELVPTAKAVTKTLTWTFNKSDGSYTESKSGTNDGSVTASNAFTGNKPLTANARYWYVVKATSASGNTEVTFTCDEKQTDYWSAKSSGTNVGYNMYRSISIQSDRTAQNLIALFSCQKTCQTITLPWYGAYKMECWGAQGGDQSRTNYSSGSGTGIAPVGGKGGYVSGDIVMQKCDLHVYVGEQGGYNNVSRQLTFNGGGQGAFSSGTTDGSGSRGGGATDIRYSKHTGSDGWSGNASLNTRIIVAAGGGGTTTYGTVTNSTGDGSGGAGGGLIGYSGKTTVKNGGSNTSLAATYATNAAGGNQSGGGAGWKWKTTADHIGGDGQLGYGGSSSGVREGGGGSGLYGGGSGGVVSHVVASGAGGSSFISGHPGCSAITGYTFTTGTTTMIDGIGKSWTTSSQTTGGTTVQMPNPSGGYYASGVGHSGDGYARITSQ